MKTYFFILVFYLTCFSRILLNPKSVPQESAIHSITASCMSKTATAVYLVSTYYIFILNQQHEFAKSHEQKNLL